MIKKRVPGPGQYRVPEITPSGRYVSSRQKHTRSISFGQPQRPYTTISQSQRLGPGACSNFLTKMMSIRWIAILAIGKFLK